MNRNGESIIYTYRGSFGMIKKVIAVVNGKEF